MRIRIYSLRPFFDIDGHFINPEKGQSFDPAHPRTYPGDEVELIEILPVNEALEKYGRGPLRNEILWTPVRGQRDTVAIWQRTGKTSADVLNEIN